MAVFPYRQNTRQLTFGFCLYCLVLSCPCPDLWAGAGCAGIPLAVLSAGVPLCHWLTVSLSSVRQPSRPALHSPLLVGCAGAPVPDLIRPSSVRHLTVPLAVCGSLCCSHCQLRRAPHPCRDCRLPDGAVPPCPACVPVPAVSLPHSTAPTSSAHTFVADVPACPAQPCQTSLCRCASCAHSRHPLPTAQPSSPAAICTALIRAPAVPSPQAGVPVPEVCRCATNWKDPCAVETQGCGVLQCCVLVLAVVILPRLQPPALQGHHH